MPASRTASIFCKNLLPLFLLMLVLAATGLAQPAQSTHAQTVSRAASGHPHALKTRQYHASHALDGLPLEYHNGPVMRTTSTSYAIFWLPPTLQDGSATSVSATYVSLIKRYFGDIGGSGLYNTATQYYDAGGSIVNSSTLGGAWMDTSPYPASDCRDTSTPGDCMSDTQFQNEVAKAMQANGWNGGLNNLFYVFTSAGEGSCVDTASSACSFTEYCAYHSYFQTNAGQNVIYANMPYTGTSLKGCGISASPNHDLDADSTINVLTHEQIEAVTDPLLNAWYDGLGNEIGDKCAWNFGNINLDGNLANVQLHNNFYLVQQEWSNADSGCTISFAQAKPTNALFIGSADGNMYALNVADGSTLWSYKTGGAVNSSPVFDGGNVYFSSNDSYLYALKASSGGLLWRRQIKGTILSSPAVIGGMIYTGSSAGSIYAFNEASGALRWRYTTIGSAATSMPVVANRMLYCSASNGYVYAINAGNGSLRWRDFARNVAFTMPVVDNNVVYVGSRNGFLYALRAANGTSLWRYTAPRSAALSAPLVAGGVVYAGASDQYMYAIRGGSMLWRFKTGGKINARPAINNGVVYIGSDNGYLYALNALSGAQNWHFQAASAVRTSPAIAGQDVFSGSDDHKVYALNIADGTVAWQFATGGAVDSSPAVAQLTS
jgi:outer membrane protein assembly factor BamB